MGSVSCQCRISVIAMTSLSLESTKYENKIKYQMGKVKHIRTQHTGLPTDAVV
jgi:hypothetical protein